jgi:hypothetical protein
MIVEGQNARWKAAGSTETKKNSTDVSDHDLMFGVFSGTLRHSASFTAWPEHMEDA